MSRDDVIRILNNKNIDTSSEIEITSYKESWDYGNKVLSAGGMRFAFDKNSKLYEITVESSTPTTLGLKLGDSVETMEKLYGKDYTISPEDVSSFYNYNMGNHFFTVYFDKGKVKTWGIQRADVYSIKEKQNNLKENNTSQSQANEWFAEDYKKVQTKYGTDYVGTKMQLNISTDKKDNKIIITSTSESGKIAHIETKWDYKDTEIGEFNFNDDDWGNKGEGSLIFQNDKIIVQIKLEKVPSSNWSIFNGEKTFTRNIIPN